jgi:hypothetical protein
MGSGDLKFHARFAVFHQPGLWASGKVSFRQQLSMDNRVRCFRVCLFQVQQPHPHQPVCGHVAQQGLAADRLPSRHGHPDGGLAAAGWSLVTNWTIILLFLCQTANFLLNTLNNLSRAYVWQILHANVNAFDVNGNPAPTFYACNQTATKWGLSL